MKQSGLFMMLFIILLWPDFEADAARPEQYDDWIAGCSNLDEIEKQELDEIIELFENEEAKKNRKQNQWFARFKKAIGNGKKPC